MRYTLQKFFTPLGYWYFYRAKGNEVLVIPSLEGITAICNFKLEGCQAWGDGSGFATCEVNYTFQPWKLKIKGCELWYAPFPFKVKLDNYIMKSALEVSPLAINTPKGFLRMLKELGFTKEQSSDILDWIKQKIAWKSADPLALFLAVLWTKKVIFEGLDDVFK